MRVESLNSRKTRASSQKRSAATVSIFTLTRPRPAVPTAMPAAVKIIADVMPFLLSGLESAP